MGRGRWLIEGCSDVMCTLIPFLREVAGQLLGVDSEPLTAGSCLVDRYWVVPRSGDATDFEKVVDLCLNEKVDFVLPTWEDRLEMWAAHRVSLLARGVQVIVSPPETIRICRDKWETYRFFAAHSIPTPATSLEHEYPVVKPRLGEGSRRFLVADPSIGKLPIDGYISQELLSGEELSIDLLCDSAGSPVYVVPRRRVRIENGRSMVAEVVHVPAAVAEVKRLARALLFFGPVNVQCFRIERGVFFTDLNPRVSGGLSLSMKATENWFRVIAEAHLGGPHHPAPVRYGLATVRHLSDNFVAAASLYRERSD
jgi:carbamoyl-phosphate synthase large subunit